MNSSAITGYWAEGGQLNFSISHSASVEEKGVRKRSEKKDLVEGAEGVETDTDRQG